MNYALLNNDNVVIEIIPEYHKDFPNIPIGSRYEKSLVDRMVKISENVLVNQGWIYDTKTKTFKEPELKIVTDPIETTIEQARHNTLQRIDGKCSAAIFSGFDLNGKHYTATMLDQSNIKDALLAFELGKTIYPYAALGEERTPHTKEQITEIANGMSAWGLVCTGYYAQLKIWIAQETDESILSTIDFGTALPDDLMQALATEVGQYGINLADYTGMLSK